MRKRFLAGLAALLAALLASPPAAWADPVRAADDPAAVEAIPVEPAVPEAEEWELSGAMPEVEVGGVDAPEDEPGAVDATPAQADAPEARLSWSELALGLGERRRLTFEGGVTAAELGASFTSSKPTVVQVNRTTGRLKALKKGKATVAVRLKDGAKLTCRVTVKAAPQAISLSARQATLGLGEVRRLKASLSRGSASRIDYISSDPKIVSVDDQGRITARARGKAKITAVTYNKKQAVCEVTVKRAPKSVSLRMEKLTLWPDDTYRLKPVFSQGSAGAYSLASSDAEVVSVSGSRLKAGALGTAVVTVTAYNGVSAQIEVAVVRRPVYRALLIGQSNFPGTGLSSLPGRRDADNMKKMLSCVQGAARGDWAVTIRYNRMLSKIHTDIQTAFAGAQEGDVSLFYISTHGDEVERIDGPNSEYAGCLYTYPSDEEWGDNQLTLTQLAAWLKEVPGQVVVFIDSCGSGAAIYTPKGVASAPPEDPYAFNEAVVNAFAAQDKGVLAPSDEKGAFVVRNKFYVMTSTAYLETGWSVGTDYSYFTKWLTDGIGTRGAMPADANGNKTTTLSELYRYVSACAKAKVFKYKGETFRQHVQVYPSGSSFKLFYRK